MADYKWSMANADWTADETRALYRQVPSSSLLPFLLATPPAPLQVHQRSAERLLQLACNNGGIWIKVGQHLGALEYLLPAEYTRTLSQLHSGAPQSSLADIARVVREDLGQEVTSPISPVPAHW